MTQEQLIAAILEHWRRRHFPMLHTVWEAEMERLMKALQSVKDSTGFS